LFFFVVADTSTPSASACVFLLLHHLRLFTVTKEMIGQEYTRCFFAADDGSTVSEAVGARSDVEVLELKVKSNIKTNISVNILKHTWSTYRCYRSVVFEIKKSARRLCQASKPYLTISDSGPFEIYSDYDKTSIVSNTNQKLQRNPVLFDGVNVASWHGSGNFLKRAAE
jgi:hypothetical protein